MVEECRLGFIVDFLSHATIVGFMGGAATVVCLQQLKSILGLEHFTHEADIVSVMRSVFSQTHQVITNSTLSHISSVFFYPTPHTTTHYSHPNAHYHPPHHLYTSMLSLLHFCII